jgi:hypothetical protein
MSIDKFTSRGFGASGARGRSSWSAPRETYKATSDTGSSFLFGGSGLRGSPTSGAQHKSNPPSNGVGLSAEAARLTDDRSSSKLMNEATEKSRKLDLSGGDITTTKLQRIVILGGLFAAALLFSLIFRAFSGGSPDTSWVQEHRAHINPDDEQ